MRKRIIIGVLLVFVLVIGWLIYPEIFNNEPKYHGKRLSFWFKQFYRSGWPVFSPDPAESNESLLAFQAMGTNAVPWLVERALEVKLDPTWQVKIHEFLNRRLNGPPYVGVDYISICAIDAVELTHPPADLLLPLVTNRLNDPNPDVRYAALRLLGSLSQHKEAAVPWLRAHLQATNGDARAAAFSLHELGKVSAPAVPELIELFRASNSGGAAWTAAAFALGSIGSSASNAIPLLQQQFSAYTNDNSRLIIAAALNQIDTGQTQALDLIIERTQNWTQGPPYGAIFCLRRIGSEAKRVVPALSQRFEDNDPRNWLIAANALWEIGETNLVLSSLSEKMASPQLTNRIEAASIALRWAPYHTLSISNLMTLVYNPTVTTIAAAKLVELRPVPPMAEPVLRAIAADKKNASRQAAIKALEFLHDEQEEQRKKRGLPRDTQN